MSEQKYVIGLDLGTTRVKALLISNRGQILASADASYPLDRTTDGAAEQDPKEWWEASTKVIRKTVKQSTVDAEEIVGLGITGQMHTAVFLDKNLEPIRPAITWADNRTSKEAEQIEETVGRSTLLDITYNRSLPGFTASKVLWLKKHEPGSFQKIRKLALPKDYLRYKLTNKLIAEKAGASATLLFNLEKEDWSTDLLSVVGLDRKKVPPLTESLSVAGEITKQAAGYTGLASGTPVIAGAGDQQAGGLGIGAIKPGVVASTIGTGGQLFTTTRALKKPKEGRIHVFRGCLPESWHIMGAMQTAGLALRWFKENVLDSVAEKDLSYDEISDLAEKASPGSNNLLFLPYLAGERSPHLDPNARGCFVGLSLNHELPHILRSIMEGVTFGMRDSLEIFREMDIPVDEIRCSGGGANSKLWKQIQADIYKQTVVEPNIEEAAALGAALMAGIDSGLFPDFPNKIVKGFLNLSETIKPDPLNIKLYDKLHKRYQALYRKLEPEFEALTNSN